MKSETLNAKRRPMTSAENPQNRAPTSIPTYTAIVRPVSKLGLNSRTACVETMDCRSRMSESTAYPKPLRQKSFHWCAVKPISSIACRVNC
jgi:hypothetical protein